MPSIRIAKQWVEGSVLTPTDRAALLAEIAEKEQESQVIAAGAAAALRSRLVEAGAAGFDLAIEADTEAKALTAAIRSGHLQAHEAREALAKVTAKLAHVADARVRFDHEAATVTAIEDDPIGWADSLYERFPITSPQFSFLG